MGPFRRYVGTTVVTLLALQTVSGLLHGEGLGAIVGAAVALVWLGWIAVLVGLPIFVALLWALPQAFRRFPTTPRHVVGIATGLAVWAIAAVVIGGLTSAVSTPGPGSIPSTPLTMLAYGVVIGAFGAMLGLIEARAS